MSIEIETPFPVEGTITPKENGFGASLPCESEWLTETENGDILQQAVDRAARKYGEGVEVEVVFRGDGHGNATEFDLLGPVENSEDDFPEELQQIKADQSKALRARKGIGDDAHPDAEGVDARTAARFHGVEDGVPLFDVVTTRVSGFPIGKDMYSQQPQNVVVRWARNNDVEVIDASDEEWSV